MGQFVEIIEDLINKNWVKVVSGLVLMGLGWFLGKRRARFEWAQKSFLHRLNVSLNILRPGEPLHIRTLSEMSCEDVFLNAVASEQILAAARKTTLQNPLLPLPKDDYWYYLNSVLNEISEQFAEGHLRRDMGLPVTMRKYLVCLTCECAGDVRTRKVRAMVIAREVLEKLLVNEPPPLEHARHQTRWQTLQILAAEYVKNPHQFLEVELCV